MDYTYEDIAKIRRCAELLRGSRVQAKTTIGFPHGGNTASVKVAEARQALADGGEELDTVVNISAVLSGNWDYVRDDIQAVIDVTRRCSRRPRKRAAAERQVVRQRGPGFRALWEDYGMNDGPL